MGLQCAAFLFSWIQYLEACFGLDVAASVSEWISDHSLALAATVLFKLLYRASSSSIASCVNMKRTISMILVRLGPFRLFPCRES